MVAFLAQLINFALALFMWLVLGRAAVEGLTLLFGGRDNFFTQFFRRFTEPLFFLVRRASFGLVGERLAPWVTVLLLFVLRVLLVPLLRAEG